MIGSHSNWKQKLADTTLRLEIPVDHPRSGQQSGSKIIYSFSIKPDLSLKLSAFGQEQKIPLSILLLAGLKALLFRYTAQEEIVVGVPGFAANQQIEDPVLQLFASTLNLRTNMDGQTTFRQLIEKVSQAVSSALIDIRKIEDFSTEELIGGLAEGPAYLPNVFFIFRNGMNDTHPPDQINIAYASSKDIEIALFVDEWNGDLKCAFQYNPALFESSTIARTASHFENILTSAIEQPDTPITQLLYLSPSEVNQLTVEFNASESDYMRDSTLTELFEAQADLYPDAAAIILEKDVLTYRQLNSRANQMAHYLKKMGVGSEVCVGVCLSRSPELIITILGILKAGGAYVPLDPDYPQERLNIMLADSRAPVLVTKKAIYQNKYFQNQSIILIDEHQAAISAEKTTSLEPQAQAGNAAYVIFTSGSTGRPKGALCVHRSVINLLTDFEKRQPISIGGTCSWWTSIGFDVSVYEIFSALLFGRALLIVPEDVRVDSRRFFEYLQTCDVKSAYITPSFLSDLAHWLESSGNLVLERLLVGVEPIKEQLLARIARAVPMLKIINGYGPTEATVCSTLFDLNQSLAQDRNIPIGRPVQNAQIYLLDKNLQPVPIGVPGEIYIGGDGLARGYINQPELTADKFVHNPFHHDRQAVLYRTGDMARYLPDGNIMFLGRFDEQVKVNGYRIELGEIDSLLSEHPAVKDVLVIAHEYSPAEKRLVAYVTLKEGDRPSSREWRTFLQKKLPNFMVPSAFVVLDAFPLTAHGKVDKKALPEPIFGRASQDHNIVLPRTTVEETIASIWARMFNLDEVGIYDNFFDLGGDSILSIQITSKTNEAGIYLTPNQIFDHPTIAELACIAEAAPTMQAEQGLITGNMPFTPIQQWFFENQFADPHHWNQGFLLKIQHSLSPTLLRKALQQLMIHHDVLRLRFRRDTNGWYQEFSPAPGEVPLTQIDLSATPEADRKAAVDAAAARLQASLNLADGPLLQAALFHPGAPEPDYLLLTIHHLVVDGVSFRILLEHLDMLYQQLARNEDPQLPPKTTSYKQWALRLAQYAQAPELKQVLPYWLRIKELNSVRLPVDHPDGRMSNTEGSARSITLCLSREDTEKLLRDVPKAYHTQMNDVLLTALAQVFTQWTGSSNLLLNLEGHGREAIFRDVDLLRTVGWFTTIFPVSLNLEGAAGQGEMLRAVKEQLRQIPDRGIGFGLLRYLCTDPEVIESLKALPEAEVSFNYLGQFDHVFSSSTLLRFTNEPCGPVRSSQAHRHHLIDITGIMIDGQIQMEWRYSPNVHRPETIEKLAYAYMDALGTIITHCQTPTVGGYTPSDFPEANLTQKELDDLLSEISALE